MAMQEGQVRADDREVFYWLVAHAKHFSSQEQWAAHSMTKAFKKTHPMHVGYTAWIAAAKSAGRVIKHITKNGYIPP